MCDTRYGEFAPEILRCAPMKSPWFVMNVVGPVLRTGLNSGVNRVADRENSAKSKPARRAGPTFQALHHLLAAIAFLFAGTTALFAAPAPLPFKPDLVVATDGSGDFKSLHAAVQSISRDNHERRVIFVKNGVYTEKVRVDAACLTVRGESRDGTRLQFAQARTDTGPRDPIGVGVLNLGPTAHDFILEHLTVINTHGELGIHAFAIFGLADRTIIQDCAVFSQGNDTLSLWRGRTENAAAVAAAMPAGSTSLMRDGGRYYHTRLEVCGSVDFICPRGWCYLSDSTIRQVNPRASAAVWHDGAGNADKKFVLRRCRFDGPPNWYLARRHHDGQFFFIDCNFSATMRDQPPYRVMYPTNGGTPTAADRQRNAENDRSNVFGDRNYFFNSHREGGDYAWQRDNLATAPGAPRPDQITAAWTFAGTWDPERTDLPKITGLDRGTDGIKVVFSESVTVKGKPRLVLADGRAVDYVSGSGSTTLLFGASRGAMTGGQAGSGGGIIVASEAFARLRIADLAVPEKL